MVWPAGGFHRQALDSPDVAWREAAIRVMPGPAATDFLAAIDEVPAQAAAQPLVAMGNGNLGGAATGCSSPISLRLSGAFRSGI